MGRKKVFQSTVIDAKTGEVLESRECFVDNDLEQFGMFRTTDGIEWFLELSEVEIKLLVLFHLWSDESGYVQFTSVRRDYALRHIGVGYATLSRALGGLVRSDSVFRIGKFDFAVNPATFFKGSSKKLKSRMDDYRKLRDNICFVRKEKEFGNE